MRFFFHKDLSLILEWNNCWSDFTYLSDELQIISRVLWCWCCDFGVCVGPRLSFRCCRSLWSFKVWFSLLEEVTLGVEEFIYSFLLWSCPCSSFPGFCCVWLLAFIALFLRCFLYWSSMRWMCFGYFLCPSFASAYLYLQLIFFVQPYLFIFLIWLYNHIF